MKIAICDDDVLCLQQTTQILTEYIDQKNISLSTFQNSSALLEEAHLLGGFDLYILDIIMPDINGIELGAKLRHLGFTGKILYLTSSRDYAIEAFNVHAYSYLLKPVQKEELLPILNEILTEFSVQKQKSIIVKTKETSILLEFDNILYAELVKKNIAYHLVSNQTVESTSIRSTFSEAIQDLLRDNRFVLCGSSTLINLHYVTELDSESVIFKNKSTLHIGRRACRELRSIWYDFWFNKGD